YFADAPAMVLMAHNTQCTTMQTHVQDLASLHRQFAPKGAEVMLINSDLRDDRSAISASASGAGVDLPILLDPTQIIGEGL
ncbi:MAG: redoxin domain-containing protein, partial [Pseudomonadales bacterium]|nr:redoxin domain-containing protein [Pseudomonadales bacterium]